MLKSSHKKEMKFMADAKKADTTLKSAFHMTGAHAHKIIRR